MFLISNNNSILEIAPTRISYIYFISRISLCLKGIYNDYDLDRFFTWKANYRPQNFLGSLKVFLKMTTYLTTGHTHKH